MFQRSILLVLLFAGIGPFNNICTAQNGKIITEWSQWMGKDRLGIWNPDLQKESFEADDLEKVWEVNIGTGYCGPTVAGGKVFLMDYAGDSVKSERVLCFDAATGNQVWIHEYECTYSRVGYPTGPRASVLIEDSRAYSFGTMGNLYCLDAATGEVLWEVDGVKDYDAGIPVWGLASSPLIEKDLIIVQMGGRPDACLVGLDKKTGREVWRALQDKSSYSAPIVINQGGKRVLVCWTADHLAGLDPGSGHVFWKVPFIRKKGIINISTPVYDPPYIFLSSFWDGSMLVKLDQNTQDAQLVWSRAGESERKTDALHCCISTPVIQDGYVYGIDSYGEFRCLDMMTGDRIWTDSTLVPYGRWANAHFVRQGYKIWAFNELGELILGKLSPSGFKDLGRVELVKPVYVTPNPRGGVNWSHPAFAGRMIYARSDAKLACYKLIK